MVSHDGILFCCHTFSKMLPLILDVREITVSYLPMNHIAAQLFDIFLTLQVGGLIYFADRNALKGSLLETLAVSKANLMFGVPRIYEKIRERFEQLEAKSSGVTKFVFSSARGLMESYHINKMANKPTSSLKYWFASRVVQKIKEIMGLQHIKGALIGGAPVTEELKLFFLGLDLPLIDAYGMSETSGGVVYNFDRPNLKTVGKAVEGIEIKIDRPNEKGEGEVSRNFKLNLNEQNKSRISDFGERAVQSNGLLK